MKKVIAFVNPDKFRIMLTDNIAQEIKFSIDTEDFGWLSLKSKDNNNWLFFYIGNYLEKGEFKQEQFDAAQIVLIPDEHSIDTLSVSGEFKVLLHTATNNYKSNLLTELRKLEGYKGEIQSVEENESNGTPTPYKLIVEMIECIYKNNCTDIQAKFNAVWESIPNFAPILNAKLNLLHSLLVPHAELSEDFSKWTELKTVADYNNYSVQTKAWETFVNTDINGKAKDFNEKPFDVNYIAALTALRDALLESNIN